MGTCSKCKGNKNNVCDKCNGSGKIRNLSYMIGLSEISGLANDWLKCHRCKGTGKKPCDKCRGTGRYNDD